MDRLLPICVQDIGILFAFPAYVFTGYPYSDEKPALSYFQRTIYFGGDRRQLHHSIFSKIEKTLAVCTGLEPVTSCVVDDARFELARGVLNIHLAFISVPTFHYSAITKRFLKWFTPLYRQAF